MKTTVPSLSSAGASLCPGLWPDSCGQGWRDVPLFLTYLCSGSWFPRSDWDLLELGVKLPIGFWGRRTSFLTEGTEVTSPAQAHANKWSFLEQGRKCWSSNLRMLGTVACSKGLLNKMEPAPWLRLLGAVNSLLPSVASYPGMTWEDGRIAVFEKEPGM